MREEVIFEIYILKDNSVFWGYICVIQWWMKQEKDIWKKNYDSNIAAIFVGKQTAHTANKQRKKSKKTALTQW